MSQHGHRQLSDLVLVAFDTETTGLSPRDGRLVEIAGVKFNLHGEVLGSFTSLIDPGVPIPPEVIRVHGITNAAVRGYPGASTVLREFFHFVGDTDTLLIAHNAPFDIGFVREEFLRNELPLPEHGVLDTLRISRQHFPFLGNHQLGTVARSLGVTVEMQHRAFADSLLVRGIAAKVFNTYPVAATLGQVKGAVPLWLIPPTTVEAPAGAPVPEPRRRGRRPAPAAVPPPAP
ncbi:MAG: 3'-5' exonuclease [Chloroflexi bacterium]|nr:3'-5' exonuclease [Chloroflexota bacterium]